MLVIRAESHKMLVIKTRETRSDLGLSCLSRPLWRATTVGNFRTFNASIKISHTRSNIYQLPRMPQTVHTETNFTAQGTLLHSECRHQIYLLLTCLSQKASGN